MNSRLWKWNEWAAGFYRPSLSGIISAGFRVRVGRDQEEAGRGVCVLGWRSPAGLLVGGACTAPRVDGAPLRKLTRLAAALDAESVHPLLETGQRKSCREA